MWIVQRSGLSGFRDYWGFSVSAVSGFNSKRPCLSVAPDAAEPNKVPGAQTENKLSISIVATESQKHLQTPQTRVFLSLSLHIHVCIYLSIHVYIYVYIHIHIHIDR